MTKYPYVVSCAGCDLRRAFPDGDRLAAWVQGHRCWEQQPTRLARAVAAFGQHATSGGSGDA